MYAFGHWFSGAIRDLVDLIEDMIPMGYGLARRLTAWALFLIIGMPALMILIPATRGWAVWFVPVLFTALVGIIISAMVGRGGPILVGILGAVTRVRYWFFYVLACVLLIPVYVMSVPLSNSPFLALMLLPVLLGIVACAMTFGASDGMAGTGSHWFARVMMMVLVAALIAITIGFFLMTPLPTEGVLPAPPQTYGGLWWSKIWGLFAGSAVSGSPEAVVPSSTPWSLNINWSSLLPVAVIFIAIAILVAVLKTENPLMGLLIGVLFVGGLILYHSGMLSGMSYGSVGSAASEKPDWFSELSAERYNSAMHRAMAGDVVAYKFHLKPGNWYRGLDISVSRDPWIIQNLRTEGRMGILFMEVHDREGRELFRGQYHDPDAEVYMQGATMDLMVQGGDGLEPLVLRIRKTVAVS